MYAPNAGLSAFNSDFMVVYLAQILHSWMWEPQVKALKQVTSLSKARADALVFGHRIGVLKEVKLEVSVSRFVA